MASGSWFNRENVTLLVQTILSILFSAVTCALWLMSKEVPGELWTATTLILGSYFTTMAGVISRANNPQA